MDLWNALICQVPSQRSDSDWLTTRRPSQDPNPKIYAKSQTKGCMLAKLVQERW